jgi:hypothetical protein
MPAPLHRLLGNIDLAADELTKLIEDLLEIARRGFVIQTISADEAQAILALYEEMNSLAELA